MLQNFIQWLSSNLNGCTVRLEGNAIYELMLFGSTSSDVVGIEGDEYDLKMFKNLVRHYASTTMNTLYKDLDENEGYLTDNVGNVFCHLIYRYGLEKDAIITNDLLFSLPTETKEDILVKFFLFSIEGDEMNVVWSLPIIHAILQEENLDWYYITNEIGTHKDEIGTNPKYWCWDDIQAAWDNYWTQIVWDADFDTLKGAYLHLCNKIL